MQSVLLLKGIVLGWSVAVPVGAINIEMVRRALSINLGQGIALGVGASIADLMYLLLVSFGLLHFLHDPILLRSIGILGSLFIAFLAINIMRSTPVLAGKPAHAGSVSVYRGVLDGYMMALLNPYNILFWASVVGSLQVTQLSALDRQVALFYTGAGLLVGILSWVAGLHVLLYALRQRFSTLIMHRLNMLGGVSLLVFALWSFWCSISRF
jgi:L-lysine exporter family protein LysE/ArgO